MFNVMYNTSAHRQLLRSVSYWQIKPQISPVIMSYRDNLRAIL